MHGWSEKYFFDHMHMHWGETSTEGSEHTIDDRRYPMEVKALALYSLQFIIIAIGLTFYDDVFYLVL